MILFCPTTRRRFHRIFCGDGTLTSPFSSKARSSLFSLNLSLSLSLLSSLFSLHSFFQPHLLPPPLLFNLSISLNSLSVLLYSTSDLAISLISYRSATTVEPIVGDSSRPSSPSGRRRTSNSRVRSSKIKPGCIAMTLTSQSSPRDPDQFPTAQLFLLVSSLVFHVNISFSPRHSKLLFHVWRQFFTPN